MKPEQLYHHLLELAEKLDITVMERNLKKTGFPVKSGLCLVKNKNLFIVERKKTLQQKIELLADCLADFSTDDIYVMPVIRELLKKPGQAGSIRPNSDQDQALDPKTDPGGEGGSQSR